VIKDEKALTLYLSKVKMTDKSKLKNRKDIDKEVFFRNIE
jgi:hypothetical protein